ncbi:MAG: hypothetical protein EOP53_00485 [Sphingobacteriales bacterium]|nr:MAG: hypothetical protein EOP53_00485 [Sphingobacteriales bacterium]
MKTLHKLKRTGFFAIVALFFFAIPAKAQFTDDPTKTPKERAELLTSWMQENLKLTDAQLGTVKSINTTAAGQMESAKTEFAGNIEGFLKRGEEIEKEHNIKMRTALTPMQWSKYQKYRDGTSMRKNKKGKMEETNREQEAEKL